MWRQIAGGRPDTYVVKDKMTPVIETAPYGPQIRGAVW